MVDERISRAIDNDHTAAMKVANDGRKLTRNKNGTMFASSGGIFVCTFCKKCFKNHLIYRKHLKIHSDKTYACQVCNKTFVYKHYLLKHLMNHNKTQQFKCHLCHKGFSQKGNLNQHMKFHSNKKPFKCDVCNKDFYQQEHLKVHKRQHSNERPFLCDICNKTFNIKSSLQRHMNCHTGAKPFICYICQRGYTRRSVLTLHIQQVHENKKPYQCSECQMCFSQKGNLQAHFRRKHLQSKSDNKKGKEKEKGKRSSIKKQNFKQSMKVPKLSLFKNEPEIYSFSDITNKNKLGRIHTFDGLSLNGNSFRIGSSTSDSPNISSEEFNSFDECELSTNDEELATPSTAGASSAHSSKISPVSSVETSELFRLFNNNDDLLDNANSNGSLPTLDNQDILYGALNGQDDIKVEFDMLFPDSKNRFGWDEWKGLDDYVLPDSALSSYESELLCSPIKLNSVLSSSKGVTDIGADLFPNLSLPLCHDYACPPQSVENTDSLSDAPFINGSLLQKPGQKNSQPEQMRKKQKDNVFAQDHLTNEKTVKLKIYKQKQVHLSPNISSLLA